MKRLLVVLCLGAASCGGDSNPSAPSSPANPPATAQPPAPARSSYTLTGTVRATNGGAVLPGVTIAHAGVSAVSDAAGRYTLAIPAATLVASLILSSPSILERRIYINVPNDRSVDLDAFQLSGFDLDFFRAIAHDAYDTPGLKNLRHWTRSPMIYIRTIEESGEAITPDTLQLTAALLSQWVPVFTRNRYGVAQVEQGTETRRGMAGWITVRWQRNPGICGSADVGLEGGQMLLAYDTPGCSCGAQKIQPRVVKHELGHAMGLWHTGRSGDLMSGVSDSACDRDPSPRELEFADYIYQRTVGNAYPDYDIGSEPRSRAH